MAALEDTTNASFLTEWPPFSYSSTPPLTEFSVFPNLMAGLGGRTLRMVTLTVSNLFLYIYQKNGANKRWGIGING